MAGNIHGPQDRRPIQNSKIYCINTINKENLDASAESQPASDPGGSSPCRKLPGRRNSGEILNALSDNDLDVAIVTLPALGRSFEVKLLIEDEMVAAFAADDVPAGKLDPAFFARQPMILLYEPAGNSRRVIDHWFRQGGELARPGMELGNIEAIKKMVGAGLGASIIPSMAMGESDEGLGVRSLSPRLCRRIGMVLRRDKVPDAALRAVIKALNGIAKS